MNFLSESLTARIKEKVKDHLSQILPQEVSNFAPPVIEKFIKESRDEVTLAKTAPEHRDCYDGLKKSYALDKDFFYSYDVYSLKRGQNDNDKDEDPSVGSDRGLKKRKTSKYTEPTTCPKKKDSTSGSSKGTKSQPKSTGKSVQLEEPMFEVADSDMSQDQAGNLGDNEDEPRDETASRCDWFKKPKPPQEPTNLDWNVGKTTKEGPTQMWLMSLAASNPTDKSLKDFDELMSTPIDFSSFVLNGLKIENLTQEILLGPAFRLLKGIRSNYAELEYDFEECYKALSEKLDWENPKGGGISTMTYTMSTTKTKAAQYDLPGIKDIVPNIWSLVKFAYDKYTLWGISHWREQHKSFYAFARGMQSRGDVYSTKRILVVTHVSVMRKHRYGYLEEIVVKLANNTIYRFKEGDFPRLQINYIEDMLILLVQIWLTNLSGDDIADFAIALRMFTRSLVIQKRVEDLQLSPHDGANSHTSIIVRANRSNLEKKRAHFMIKDINKLLKERRMMRSLEKFVGGRLYETDLRLLQRTNHLNPRTLHIVLDISKGRYNFLRMFN
ncbi:hypothetical protein Tco_0104673 [Tanacetum coccineum]